MTMFLLHKSTSVPKIALAIDLKFALVWTIKIALEIDLTVELLTALKIVLENALKVAFA